MSNGSRQQRRTLVLFVYAQKLPRPRDTARLSTNPLDPANSATAGFARRIQAQGKSWRSDRRSLAASQPSFLPWRCCSAARGQPLPRNASATSSPPPPYRSSRRTPPEPIEVEFEPNGEFGEDAAANSAGVISASAVENGDAPQSNVRPKPDSLPFDFTEPAPTEAPPEATQDPSQIRLDDPVLRWLPEIRAASEASGTPAHIIAGVMRLESNGNPNIISPAGARGQMQIMPSNLVAMGVPEHLWHDPATNVMAGGQFLASRAAEQGSWEGAVGAYFGFGCDVFGTCTEVYISVAMGWAYYYLPAIEDPLNSGFALLPADWVAPPIAPFVEAAPPKVETPPAETPTPAPHPRRFRAKPRPCRARLPCRPRFPRPSPRRSRPRCPPKSRRKSQPRCPLRSQPNLRSRNPRPPRKQPRRHSSTIDRFPDTTHPRSF